MEDKINYWGRSGRKRMSLEEKFWEKVDKKGEDECWNWKGALNKDRYGQFNYKGKPKLSHIVSYILVHGNVPKGLFILHKCNNPSCVNPKHLYIGTQADNMKQMVKDGRSLYGEKNPNSKLNWEIVNKIRAEYVNDRNITIRKLSNKYNMPLGTIQNIIEDKTWKDDKYKRR